MADVDSLPESAPQLESGFTQLANELLEAMLRAGFSARQWAVVMTVVRKTYGYGKKADDISLGQIVDMTGIAKPHASRTVNDLVAANVLKRSVGTFGHRLSINKRYQQWTLGKSSSGVTESVTKGLPKQQPPLPKQQPFVGVTETATPVTNSVTGDGVTDSVIGVTDSVTGYRFGHAEVTDSVTTKEHSTKERKTSRTIRPDGTGESHTPRGQHTDADEPSPEFMAAWKLYPSRGSRGNPRKAAWKAWRARIRDGVPAQEMIDGVARYAAHIDAEGKTGTQFVMMASTFFGPDERWKEPYGTSRQAGTKFTRGNAISDPVAAAIFANRPQVMTLECLPDGGYRDNNNRRYTSNGNLRAVL